ncbi:MAG: MotA/TolQ/ExbB proton channel family protein [Oligoflexia bacterium]|nr:MotA/TolQ/ExbB proton channel family protein [Oligoflexia bacterium]
MEEVFYILYDSIKKDSISRVFSQIIIALFFIGALPGLISASSYIHKKIPLLTKIPKNPILFIILIIIGAVTGFYLSLLSWVFSVLLFIFFFIAISARFEKLTVLSIKPSLLTTIGILGTFVGVYIGLDNFNIANIDASIPDLLRGLKVAFTTSIVGIVAAILLKMIQSHIPAEREEQNIVDIFNNIYQVLQNHFEESKIQHRQTLEKTDQNINEQNKMIQYLYSKMNSLEQSIKNSAESFNKPLNEIQKDKIKSESLNE